MSRPTWVIDAHTVDIPSGSGFPNAQQARSNINADQSARLILFSHEFPSGEVQDLLRRLHRHAKIPRYTQLARFLQESALVLRQEIPKLPRPLRDLVPPFHDVMTLASRWDELKVTPLRSIWEGVFLCIYEIAMLIGLVFS